ncbi:MAG: hypothetical protein V1708_01525 [Candidatus Micrarchaeota archaeon]
MAEDGFEKLATFFVYLGAVAILLWALLKSFGIIHSPVWVDMIPFFGGGVSILALAYRADRFIQKIEQKIDEMTAEVKKIAGLSDRILTIETRCEERHSPKKR